MVTSDPLWITIDEAFAKLKQYFGSRDLAIYTLLGSLKDGSLRARGRQLKSQSAYIDDSTKLIEIEIGSETWIDAKLSTRANDPSRLGMQVPALTQLGRSWYISVDGLQIDKLIKVSGNERKYADDSKTGAQEKHNWSGAFAYCGWYVARNGLPSSKKELQRIVERWFVEIDGGVPKGERELYRRVCQAYDELLRSGATASDGLKPTSDP